MSLSTNLDFNSFAEIANNWWVYTTTANQWLTTSWGFLVRNSWGNDDWWFIQYTINEDFVLDSRIYFSVESWWYTRYSVVWTNWNQISMYFWIDPWPSYSSYRQPVVIQYYNGSSWINLYTFATFAKDFPAWYYKVKIQNIWWLITIKLYNDFDVLLWEGSYNIWTIDFIQIYSHKWFDRQNYQKIDYVYLNWIAPVPTNTWNFFLFM